MIQLPPDFKEFLALLNVHNVRYLVVGGYAVGLHGYPRATGDLDVWVAVDTQNAETMVTVLNKFGFNMPELTPALLQQEGKIIRLGTPPLRIEIHTGLSGVEFEECYDQRVEEVVERIPVNFIDLQHLRQNKRASHRYKDLDDLKNLPE